ncbi:hypothetical protein BQ8794_10216 [Mesorhizobium prunaredense]|uniref:Uncharacterized protein n=1 Tax=Mesorhizobium prunaredense TaxID=1631249 RepID=A0A1R3V0V1_9HYPH|nr:hypothetical protein BQ8794_10216 [Mesorhizobium prunaredense]
MDVAVGITVIRRKAAIPAKAGKQIARDVTNCRKCKGRNGLMGLSLIGPLVLKEERQDEHRPGYRAVL